MATPLESDFTFEVAPQQEAPLLSSNVQGAADNSGWIFEEDSSAKSFIMDKGDVGASDFLSEVKKQLIRHEDIRTTAYTDSTGTRTIGVGFSLTRPDAKVLIERLGYDFNKVYSGKQEISDVDVSKLLDVTTSEAAKGASTLVSNYDTLSPARKAVLTNMVFNMGTAGVKKFKPMLKAIEEEDWDKASKAMLLTRTGENYQKWIHQTKARGIELASIMRLGDEPVASLDEEEGIPFGPIQAKAPNVPTKVKTTGTIKGIEGGVIQDLKDFITDTYVSFREHRGPTRSTLEMAAIPKIQRPEYSVSGEYQGSREETDDEYNERIERDDAERRRRSGFDQASDGAKVLGAIAGEIIDPAAILTARWGLAKQGLSRLWRLAAGGGAYEASSETLDQLRREHEVTDEAAILTRGAIGATAAPVLDRAVALGKAIYTKHGAKKAEEALTKLETSVVDYRNKGLNPGEAFNRALRDTKLIEDTISEADRLRIKKKAVAIPIDTPAKKEIFGTSNYYKLMSTKEFSRTIVPSTTEANGILSKIHMPKGADKLFGILSTRIKNMSVSTFSRMRRMEMNIHSREAEYDVAITPFLRDVKSIKNDKLRQDLTLALFHGDKKDIATVLSKINHPTLGDNLKNVRGLLDSIHSELDEAGIKTSYLENYFPRSVKDHDKLINIMGAKPQSALTKALRNAEKAVGDRELTKAERADVINKALSKLTKEELQERRPGFTKGRTVEELDAEMLQAYDSLENSLTHYVFRRAHDIEKAKLFGRSLVVDPNANINIDSSIGAMLDAELKQDNITLKEFTELRKLISARFIGGEKEAHKGFIGGYRNIMYASLLGQYKSAVTQLSDLGVSAYLNGFKNTFSALTSKNIVDMEKEFGLHKIAQEMTTTGGTAKLMDWSFRVSGFKAVDKLGKNTILNSSLKKYTKLASSKEGIKKLVASQKDIFGEELNPLIKDLRAGRVTENVKLLLWNDLADVQPISLLEMPEAWLNVPGGRIFYSLKTFTLKQMDIHRRDAIQQMLRGDKKKGAQNLAKYIMYLTAAGMTTDSIKSWMTGEEPELEDLVVTNLLKQAGASKYIVDYSMEQGLGSGFIKLIAPPVNIPDHITQDLGEFGQKFSSLKDIPVAGGLTKAPGISDVLHNFLGGGIEDSWKKELEKIEKRHEKLMESIEE